MYFLCFDSINELPNMNYSLSKDSIDIRSIANQVLTLNKKTNKIYPSLNPISIIHQKINSNNTLNNKLLEYYKNKEILSRKDKINYKKLNDIDPINILIPINSSSIDKEQLSKFFKFIEQKNSIIDPMVNRIRNKNSVLNSSVIILKHKLDNIFLKGKEKKELNELINDVNELIDNNIVVIESFDESLLSFSKINNVEYYTNKLEKIEKEIDKYIKIINSFNNNL